MGLKNFIKSFAKNEVVNDRGLSQQVLSEMPEDLLRIEAANRSTGGKNISSNIKVNGVNFVPKNIKDWKDAGAIATDPEQPNLGPWSELVENLLLDAHTMSVIESRIMRVLRSKWDLVDANGKANEDLKKLLNRPWFETFMYQAVLSKFTGIKVLELFHTNEEGELVACNSIPMAHILPHRQEIAKEEGDEKGTSYIGGSLANYYVEIGNNGSLGSLYQVATYILAKKQAMGAWLDHLHKFGVPPIIINTDNYDKTRQQELLNMGMALHKNHVMVTQGNENFEIGKTDTGNSVQVFKEFYGIMNSEISKFFLGQDGTTQNKDGAGTYGSLKVMQEVANDRHESDKLFIQYIINSELLPRLPKINSFYSALANVELDWDETDQMDKGEMIDKAVALSTAGFELDLEELKEKTGMPIIGFRAPMGTTPPSEGKGNSKKKSEVTPKK